MEWYYIIAIILGPLFVLMFVGLPVAFSFLAVNIVGSFVLLGGLPGIKQLVLNSVDSVSSFVLIPIALFMIMGEAMFRSGIAIDLMDTLDKWFGRLRGRLALMAVGGGVLFSTLTGNSMGSIALLGSSLTPEMEKRGLQKTDVAWSDPGFVRSGNYDPTFGFGSCARRHSRTLNPPDPNRHHYSGSVDGAAVHHLYTWTLPATTRASALIRRAKGFSF